MSMLLVRRKPNDIAEFGLLKPNPETTLARFYESAAKGARKPKSVANWILNDLQSALAAAGRAISDCPIRPEALDELKANPTLAGQIFERRLDRVEAHRNEEDPVSCWSGVPWIITFL